VPVSAALALEPACEVKSPRVVSLAAKPPEGGMLLVVTMMRRSRLEITGEAEFDGRGVSYSASRDRTMFANRRVVVVGGGNGAFENALLLADVRCQVPIVTRSLPRTRHEFLQRAAQDGRIEVLGSARLTAINGTDWVKSVRIESEDRGFERPMDGVAIKMGV